MDAPVPPSPQIASVRHAGNLNTDHATVFCGIVAAQEIFTVDSDPARQRAERLFKKEQRAQDGRRAAATEYEAEARATREKTERLKALRLTKVS
jgi:hypothetical protein